MQRYNAIWWQAMPTVGFLLPQVLGNRVAAWGSGAESDECVTLEDLPQVFPVSFASEGTRDFAHPHLL